MIISNLYCTISEDQGCYFYRKINNKIYQTQTQTKVPYTPDPKYMY